MICAITLPLLQLCMEARFTAAELHRVKLKHRVRKREEGPMEEVEILARLAYQEATAEMLELLP